MANLNTTKDNYNATRLTEGYAAWAEQLQNTGWTPYLLTFTFRPIGGSPATLLRIMEGEIERVFASHVTRVVRKPAALSALGRLPVWLCWADLPVFKRSAARVSDVFVNNGLHWHAVVFNPPWSRLREDLVSHFLRHEALYVRPDHPLVGIDVEPVTRRLGYVVGYGRKNVIKGRVSEGATLILPRTRSELRNIKARRSVEMRGGGPCLEGQT